MSDQDHFGTYLGLMALKVADGGLVNSPEMATKLAEMFLERGEGPAAVERARPWTVVDYDKVWHVIASHEGSFSEERTSPWAVKIQKLDAKVVWIGRNVYLPITPDMLKPPE